MYKKKKKGNRVFGLPALQELVCLHRLVCDPGETKAAELKACTGLFNAGDLLSVIGGFVPRDSCLYATRSPLQRHVLFVLKHSVGKVRICSNVNWL